VENCRKIVGKDKEHGVTDAPVKKKSDKEQAKVYVQTADKRIEQSKVKDVSNHGTTISKPIIVDENVADDINVILEKDNIDTSHEVELAMVTDKDKDNIVSPLLISNRFADLQQDPYNVLIGPTTHDGVNLENVDSDSSHESDYVESTSLPLPKDTVEPVLTLVSDIPPIVQQDMVFSKESWTNMQEQDEAEANLREETENSAARALQAESSFQIVSSKNKKKKSNSPLRKETYETRSKVSTQKPFR
jgi:hypothetical protein